ncbi:MAG: cbb3-type cytochrome c oxidase N-terminal domain-containing protein [Candidatus Kapabacteria bacterium]|nr:cbb3-type cytochrome c oxidase N-terminal domain-containing protein [Candidatus Kapabacteria bacterium]
MSEDEDKILEHNYDGIQEFDNPLPRWWVGLFILTIIWSLIYMFYYHVSDMGPNQTQEYAAEFKVSSDEYAKIAKNMNQMWSNVVFEAANDPASLESGKEIFMKNCVSCHGNSGEGGIGPNLTDNYSIHGFGIENTMKTIINGVPDKGMISWKPLLKPDDVRKVASYILSLEGSNPPNPKAPQGNPPED